MNDAEGTQKNQGNITISGSVTSSDNAVMALGHGTVIHHTVHQSGATLDAAGWQALQTSLQDLYDQLGEQFSGEQKRTVLRAADQAIQAAEEQNPRPDAVAGKLQEMSQAIDKTGTRIQAGTKVAASLLSIAHVAAPLVAGGARVIAGWFGLPL